MAAVQNFFVPLCNKKGGGAEMDAFLEYAHLYLFLYIFIYISTPINVRLIFANIQIQSFTLGYSYPNNKRFYIPETVSKWLIVPWMKILFNRSVLNYDATSIQILPHEVYVLRKNVSERVLQLWPLIRTAKAFFSAERTDIWG